VITCVAAIFSVIENGNRKWPCAHRAENRNLKVYRRRWRAREHDDALIQFGVQQILSPTDFYEKQKTDHQKNSDDGTDGLVDQGPGHRFSFPAPHRTARVEELTGTHTKLEVTYFFLLKEKYPPMTRNDNPIASRIRTTSRTLDICAAILMHSSNAMM
jgi:hypothetical protein